MADLKVLKGGMPTHEACGELHDAIMGAIEDKAEGMAIPAVIGILELVKLTLIEDTDRHG